VLSGEAGAPDYGRNGPDQEGARTDAGDAIANILHHLFATSTEQSLDAREVFALSALDTARGHFTAELRHQL
jgi:hypothetical protein